MRRGAILVILVLILISSGCIEELRYETKPVEKTEKDPKSEVLTSCKSKAMELIPETLELFTPHQDDTGFWFLVSDQLWKDNSTIDYISESDYFRLGSGTGQNPNYYYPTTRFTTDPFPLTYSKEMINDKGTILGTRTFSILPALKPVEGTEGTYTRFTFEYPTKKFEVVETNFVECNWVTDQY